MIETDLRAYLARIGLADLPEATPEGVAQVLGAHRRTIAFENLDVLLGQPIRIDGQSVFAKLVTGQRGGYCFEHNRLFSDALAALGLANRALLARVRLVAEPGDVPPRTHILLLVETLDGPWIADAGFGGAFLPPLPLRDGATAATPDGALHRLIWRRSADPLDGEWLLERAGSAGATDGRAQAGEGEWQAQYSFDLAEVAQADLEQANHWTSTRAGTRFTTLRVVSRVLPDGFASLSDRRLTIHAGGQSMAREIADRADHGAVLREVFGLELGTGQLARLWPDELILP